MRHTVSLALTFAILFALCSSSSAAVVVTPSAPDAPASPISFDGSSGTRSVTFTAADFANAGAANTIIQDIEIVINFSKLANSPNPPFYSQIGFSLTSSTPEVPAATLIAAGSFGPGNVFPTLDPGFNGLLSFSASATTAVNAVPGFGTSKIPDTGDSFLPTAPTSLNAFLGQDGVATYTLTISDSQNGNDPLIYRGFTVNITAVPEPSSFGVAGLCMAGMFIRRRRN